MGFPPVVLESTILVQFNIRTYTYVYWLMRWLLLLASVVHEVAPWGGQETVVKANDGRWTVWSVLSHPR